MTPALIDDLFAAPNVGEDAERESPPGEQQSEARQYGDNNTDLPLELQNALLCLVQEAQRQDLYQRRIEVMRDRRNRFYERGIQHIYEDSRGGVFVQASPGAVVPDGAGGELQCGQYLGDYNIFGRSLWIVVAKLTENPVGVDFQPDSGDNSVDLQASEAAEAYRLLYDRRNDVKELATAIVRMFGLSGRVVLWTRTMADKHRWGTDEQGAPRRMQTSSVYGTLETKVPILAKTLQECPYCIISEDPHLFVAKMEHPEFAEKICEKGDDGIADTQFERLARIGALQGAASAFQLTDTYQFYVERKYAFFRPSMFMDKSLDSLYFDERHADDPEGWTLRDALREAFPDGCQAIFIGSQYVGSRNVSMDDELAVGFPFYGEGMSRKAYMDDAVQIQDDFNDDMNNYHEVKVVGWPSTWMNEDVADMAAINDQDAAPYCFRALKSRPPRDAKMEDQFFREPNPEIPASFMQSTEYMATQLLQFILAIPSAVQGAGMPDQKTASGYNAALQQALGQLGIHWGAVQGLMSTVYRQAALAAARDDHEQKTIVIPSVKGSVTLNLADLGKGHFLAHPDIDSGYPESTVQKRATLATILDFAMKDPVIAQAVFQSPDTWDFIFRTFGVTEIKIMEAVVRRKQLAEIELLVMQSPARASPEELEAAEAEHAANTMVATGTGAPPPDPFNPAALPQHSSIQPDPLDYHDWEFEECREKLSDWSWVQQQINAGNQAGIDNLRLHAMEHQAYVQAAAAAQASAQMAQAAASAPQKPGGAGKPAGKQEPPQPAGPQEPEPPIQ